MNTKTIARLKKLAQAADRLSRENRAPWFAEQTLLDDKFLGEDAAFIAFATPRRILWLIEQIENNRG